MSFKLLFSFSLLSFTTHALEFEFKGFLKAEVVNTNNGVGSYSNTYSHVSPTRALRTDRFSTNGSDNIASTQQNRYLRSSSTSFQAAQSRLNLGIKKNQVHGLIELDFIDGEDGFSNQTALQSLGPRIRLATIDYNFTDHVKIFIGQIWEFFSTIQ